MSDRDSTPRTPQPHRDEQAFEITVSQLIWKNGLKVQRVYIDHNTPRERFVTVREYNPFLEDGESYFMIETDGLHAPEDIPALTAALQRARGIAERWAESDAP